MTARTFWAGTILTLMMIFIGSAAMSLGMQTAADMHGRSEAFADADPASLARGPLAVQAEIIRSLGLFPSPAPPPSKPGRKVTASWYGERHENRLTASGERFRPHRHTLAHRTLPLGTRVRLYNPSNGRFAEGIVNDRGPFIKGRDVDLSYGMAQKLGILDKGVIGLRMETM